MLLLCATSVTEIFDFHRYLSSQVTIPFRIPSFMCSQEIRAKVDAL